MNHYEETPEQAYQRLLLLDNQFDRIEVIIGRYIEKPHMGVINPMLRALNNDAGNKVEGWGERLFFFLKGLEASGQLPSEHFRLCLEGFEGYDEGKFYRYTEMYAKL